jgi:beta-lactamase regulating signal transducer with metallopeptidase domain
MTDLFPTLVPLLGRALLDFVWQGAVIGLIAGIVLAAMGNARPQARYAVGCLALLACVLAPMLDVIVLLTSQSIPVFATVRVPLVGMATDTTTALPAVVAWAVPFEIRLPLVVALWSAGASVFLLRHAAGVAWVARMRARTHDTVTRQQWQRRLDALAMRFDLARAPVLRLVDRLESPASAGWLRPVVLLPAALVMRMPVDQIEALLAHELAHLQRNDYLVNLMQCVVEALLFYHPVVWWLSREVRRERERIADQLAADACGSPRTLAIALSTLSGLVSELPPHVRCPSPPLAQAAHGGHLMSRIEQLVRPGRTTRAGRFAFPVLGLAAACIAFYAHAQFTTLPLMQVQAGANTAITTRADVHGTSHQPFALVRADHTTMTMAGSTRDIDDIKAAGRGKDGEYLWFKRDGKAYVVTDPAVLARVKTTWRDTDALGEQMDALGKQMEQHGKVMEALGSKMETLSASQEETPAMREAERRMETLGAQQEALGKQQEALAHAQANAGDAAQHKLDSQRDALSQQMEALAARMEEQSRIMQAESTNMQRNAEPMEALSRQMEEASKPMEALGARMDVMGKRMDELSAQATRETSAIIDEAMAKQLAATAP